MICIISVDIGVSSYYHICVCVRFYLLNFHLYLSLYYLTSFSIAAVLLVSFFEWHRKITSRMERHTSTHVNVFWSACASTRTYTINLVGCIPQMSPIYPLSKWKWLNNFEHKMFHSLSPCANDVIYKKKTPFDRTELEWKTKCTDGICVRAGVFYIKVNCRANSKYCMLGPRAKLTRTLHKSVRNAFANYLINCMSMPRKQFKKIVARKIRAIYFVFLYLASARDMCLHVSFLHNLHPQIDFIQLEHTYTHNQWALSALMSSKSHPRF